MKKLELNLSENKSRFDLLFGLLPCTRDTDQKEAARVYKATSRHCESNLELQ